MYRVKVPLKQRMVWFGLHGTLNSSDSSHPAVHYIRLLMAQSNLALIPSRAGASTASLDKLCHHLIALWVRNFPVTSDLNPSSFHLPLPLVRSLSACVKKSFSFPFTSSLRALERCSEVSCLCSRLNSSRSPSLFSRRGALCLRSPSWPSPGPFLTGPHLSCVDTVFKYQETKRNLKKAHCILRRSFYAVKIQQYLRLAPWIMNSPLLLKLRSCG